MPRSLDPLVVPAGAAVLDLLEPLAAMLEGRGPALLPVSGQGDDRGLAGPLAEAEDDPDDPTALAVSTSGSTGDPKAALLPVSALRASVTASAERLSAAGAQWLLALPADHIAGLGVLLRSVVAGTEPVVLDGPFTATGFTSAVARMTGPDCMVSLVPTQLHRILADPEAAAAAASMHAVLLGGAAASPGLLDRARAAGITVVVSYGMSETCGGCVYDGRPLDGVTVHIDRTGSTRFTGHAVDTGVSGETDATSDAPTPGRVILAGAVVARGYRHRPGDPAFDLSRPVRAFRTSDLGRVTDARLRVLGRADDVIVTGGVKIAPAEVEAAIAGLAEIRDVLVTGLPDPEWGEIVVALVETDLPPGDRLTTVVREAARTVHAAASPRRVLPVPAIPRLGIGKPDRAAARALAVRQ